MSERDQRDRGDADDDRKSRAAGGVDRDALLATFKRYFFERVPHNEALGLQILGIEGGHARARLPYRDHLVGNPATGVIHGGAISSLLDATAGAAVFARLEAPIPIATLDLRIDYLRPATPGQDVIADAVCYKLTRNVAFVRGIAFGDDPDDHVASAVGTFALLRRRKRRPRDEDREGGR